MRRQPSFRVGCSISPNARRSGSSPGFRGGPSTPTIARRWSGSSIGRSWDTRPTASSVDWRVRPGATAERRARQARLEAVVRRLRGGDNRVQGGAARILAPDQRERQGDDRLDGHEYRLLESRTEGRAYIEHDPEAFANGLCAEIGVGVSVRLEARGAAGVKHGGGVARAVLAARHQQRLSG